MRCGYLVHTGKSLVREHSEEWDCWDIGYICFHLYQITYVPFHYENVSQGKSAVTCQPCLGYRK